MMVRQCKGKSLGLCGWGTHTKAPHLLFYCVGCWEIIKCWQRVGYVGAGQRRRRCPAPLKKQSNAPLFWYNERPKGKIGFNSYLINYYDPEIARGRLLAVQQCGNCHSVGLQTMPTLGKMDFSLRPLARILYERGRTTAEAIDQHIQAIGAFPYMHPFQGTDEERRALAKYLEALVEARYGTAPKLTAQK